MWDTVDGNDHTASTRNNNTAMAQTLTMLNTHTRRRTAPSRRPVETTTRLHVVCTCRVVGHTPVDASILIVNTDGKQTLSLATSCELPTGWQRFKTMATWNGTTVASLVSHVLSTTIHQVRIDINVQFSSFDRATLSLQGFTHTPCSQSSS